LVILQVPTTDPLLLYIMSCNRSCSSCQLRYVQ